jgi:hypothetical protein
MTSARRTLALSSFALAWATHASSDHVRLPIEGSLGPNYSLDDSTTASAGLQLCRARDAHRRPASASISQHEETGNSRSLQVANFSLFFCCLDELAVPSCRAAEHCIFIRVAQRGRGVHACRPLICCFVPSTRKNKPVEVSVGRWLDAALPDVVVSPPHAMEGVSSVSRLSAGAPQVGRVITLPRHASVLDCETSADGTG